MNDEAIETLENISQARQRNITFRYVNSNKVVYRGTFHLEFEIWEQSYDRVGSTRRCSISMRQLDMWHCGWLAK